MHVDDFDFAVVKATYINCTLKRSPELSHTQRLTDRSISLMQSNGVSVDTFRLVGFPVALGVYPDMRDHSRAEDA